MKYSIDLQSPFSFSPYWYAVGIALIVLALLLRFGFNRLFAVKMDSPFRIDKLRRDCLRQVGKIEQAYNNKEIDSRWTLPSGSTSFAGTASVRLERSSRPIITKRSTPDLPTSR